MIRGKVTRSRKEDLEGLGKMAICCQCNEVCTVVPVDESYDDQFGTVTNWQARSSCCHNEYKEIPDHDDQPQD